MSNKCLLTNTFTRLLQNKKLTIAVIGNSVTYGAAFDGQRIDSYYVRLVNWFKKQFPETQITTHLGIIFAIGPEVQLFRMDDKVLACQPDLVVAEFGAANGAWGEAGRPVTDPATEGYVRRLRLLRPESDLLVNLGLFKTLMDDYRQGRTPGTVIFIKKLGEQYGFVVTDSGAAIAQRVVGGEPWEQFMNDGIHPGPGGYDIHGQVIERELDRQWALYQGMSAAQKAFQPHAVPHATVVPQPWTNPRLLSAGSAQNLQGFAQKENGRVKFIEGTTGATGRIRVETGRIVGVLFHVGAQATEERADVEFRFDSHGEWRTFQLKSEPRFPEDDDRTNYFRRVFFGGYGLQATGFNELEFRAAPDAKGNTARICGFFVIEPESPVAAQ